MRIDIPSVVLDPIVPLPGRRSVGSDLRGGADRVVDHLITVHGLTDIALVIGHSDPGLVDPRELGWRDAQQRHGLAEGPIARASFDRPGGYAAMRELLAAARPPQAVFASSDLQATGVLRALHEAGLRIPEQVAVVGFDGTSESAFTNPALTVARQPIADIARRAHALLTDHAVVEVAEHLPTELVVRRSCGCAGSAAAN